MSFPLADGAHHKKPHSPTHPPIFHQIWPISWLIFSNNFHAFSVQAHLQELYLTQGPLKGIDVRDYIDSYVQDCSISSVLAMEILQSYTKPLIYYAKQLIYWWLRARLEYLKCVSNGDTAILH